MGFLVGVDSGVMKGRPIKYLYYTDGYSVFSVKRIDLMKKNLEFVPSIIDENNARRREISLTQRAIFVVSIRIGS